MMDTAQKQALTKCRVHIVKHLHLGELFDSIKVQEIFTDLTLEDIKESNQSRAERVRALLDYLPRRPQAFDKFILCLRETRQDDIANCIIEAYLSALGPGEPVPVQYRELPFPTQASLISGQGHGGDHSIQESMIVDEQDGDTHGYSGNTEEEYRMESEPRGVLLIIDTRNFTESSSDRDGSDVDCDKLKHLFQQLGFGVDVRIDLSAQEICDCLLSLSRHPTLQGVDSLAVAILTHGSEEILYGVDGEYITVNDAFEYFTAENCPNLHHKPKLFILNACRGEHEDRGSLAAQTGVNRSVSRDVHEEIPGLPFVPGDPIWIPNLKDFLVAYPTIPGLIARMRKLIWSYTGRICSKTNFRMTRLISYVDHIAPDVPAMRATLRLISQCNPILQVNHEVAQNMTNDQGVQIPEQHIMLTKTWYLNPPPR